MVRAAKPIEQLGNQYGKPDIERLGIFSEMPYMNGRGYVSPFEKPKLVKGKNLLPGGPKVKCDWQDCYFDKEFKRLYTGEAIKGRGRPEKPSAFKNVSERPFVPPGDTKLHSTPGDWFGTFQGKMEAVSNKKWPVPPFKHEGPNVLTSPAKKGGPGYTGICLNPYPEHSVEKYGTKQKFKEYGRRLAGPMVLGMHPKTYFEINPYKNPANIKDGPTYVPPKEKQIPILPPGKLIPTGPAKSMGGCKAGCFDKFPAHVTEKYKSVYEALKSLKPQKAGLGKFVPPTSGGKTLNTFSVLNENLRFRVNESNYESYKPNYIKHLMKLNNNNNY